LLSLLAGDCDVAYVPRTNISDVIDVADLNKISGLPELTIDCFYFNQAISSDSPYIGSGQLDGNGIPGDFFADIDVRKGFSYAFDWDTYIEEAMQGEAEQRASCIVEGLPYYNPDAPKYTLDLAKAEEHLKAAFGGQVWEKGFKLTLIYNTGNLVRKVACEILANNLFTINPKFQISVLAKTWTSTMTLLRSRTLAMYQIGWLMDYADPDNFVVPYMASYGVFSYYASYSNAEVDDLIAEGAVETDSAARQQIYYDLQQLWYDTVPGIAIAQPLGRRFFTKYVHGFYFNPGLCGTPGPLYYMTKSAA
jgi:peptide/nickel transport system substrate-binding protein